MSKTVHWALAAGILMAAQSAQATVVTYGTTFSGAAESTPTGSAGVGTGFVTIDSIANTLEVVISFSGLTGTTMAAHDHCCTVLPGVGSAGIATVTPTFPGFPLGVTSGSYDHTFDLASASTYNTAFVTANGGVANAEVTLTDGLAAGLSYLNIHTSAFPSGEIRGYLTLAVPEPASTAALGGLLAIGLLRRRRA